MISRFQAIALGIVLGIAFFVLYLHIVPNENVEKLTFREKASASRLSELSSLLHTDTMSSNNGFAQNSHQAQTASTPNFTPDPTTLSKNIDAPTVPGNRNRDPAVYCPKMKRRYHIVPGSSWGTTTLEQQRTWTNLNCDQYLPNSDSEQSSTTETAEQKLPPNESKKSPPIAAVVESKEEESEEEDTVNIGMPVLSKSNKMWCKNAREKYGVKPMKSWGKLPSNMINDWKSKHCDLVFTANRMGKRPLSLCPNSNSSSSNPDSHSNLVPTLPLIAIMAATTTRRIPNPSTSNLALFTLLLPSLMRSLDCGYRYEYVLGYDQGDPFYDSVEGMKEVKKWFYKNVHLPMKKNGILLKLKPVKVNNTLKKPGPVFLEMARAAYADGAEYFYRINDDTELTTSWPNVFVSTLQSLGVPFGVIGPNCDQGNQKILTHDFVHRTHMEIFEMNYYPPQLSDWWMDDWISWVYGQTRTFKARATSVIHHTGAHGQRYQVDPSHEFLLDDLVRQGRQKIRQYMLKKQVSEDVLKRFDQDVGKPGFTHRDVPAGVKDKFGLH